MRHVSLLILLFFLALLALPCSADSIQDQSNTEPFIDFRTGVPPGWMLAQAFTAGFDGYLTGVAVDVCYDVSPGHCNGTVPVDWTIAIYDTVAGLPNFLLTSETVSAAALSLVDVISFSNPIFQLAGTEYAVAVASPLGVRWFLAPNPNFERLLVKSTDSGWGHLPAPPGRFITYASVPEPSSLALLVFGIIALSCHPAKAASRCTRLRRRRGNRPQLTDMSQVVTVAGGASDKIHTAPLPSSWRSLPH